WAQERDRSLDQFNSVHERLIEAWGRVKKEMGPAVWFCAMQESIEDTITANYLRDTAVQAGLKTEYLAVEDIGCREKTSQFVDLHDREMSIVFKLYPWEWMLSDQFGKRVALSPTRWLEPPWKMVLSSKGLLAVLWELFPDCPYLLPTYRDAGPLGGGRERQGLGAYVEKPLRSREGANVRIVQNGAVTAATGGPYRGACVYQAVCEPPRMGDVGGGAQARPIIGSWMVNGYACGIGIREDNGPITGNTSRFVPHVIEH
ncbi:MAG: glutathionylspermidine synthase family protein, partial [Phycisphaerales bacterium]|nr:glutathionylspermidine synthase family protein [Phycisphaerales bacterium]